MRICPLLPHGPPAGSGRPLPSTCPASVLLPQVRECPSLKAGVGAPGTTPAHGLTQSAPWTVLCPPSSQCPMGRRASAELETLAPPGAGRQSLLRRVASACAAQAHSPPPVASGFDGFAQEPQGPHLLLQPQHPESGRVDAKVGVAFPSRQGLVPGAWSSCCPWAGGCPAPPTMAWCFRAVSGHQLTRAAGGGRGGLLPTRPPGAARVLAPCDDLRPGAAVVGGGWGLSLSQPELLVGKVGVESSLGVGRPLWG